MGGSDAEERDWGKPGASEDFFFILEGKEEGKKREKEETGGGLSRSGGSVAMSPWQRS